MDNKIKELIQQLDLDISGKWARIESIELLLKQILETVKVDTKSH